MSEATLPYVVALIVILLVIPLAVMLLVRVFVPLTESAEALAEEPEGAAFNTLGDFWQSMVPHLIELRDRLVKAMLAIGIGTSFGFWLVNSSTLLGEPLPDFLVHHLAPGMTLQAIRPEEIFVSYLRIALVVGIALAMPVVIYQLVAFFMPALLPHEKRMVFTALPFVTELFLAGLAFGWFFTVPAAMQFLQNYGRTETIRTEWTPESFMGTTATLLLWNGLIFQLPALIYLLARLGVVTTKQLGSWRRYAIVIITIIAALITPTGDPFNLLLLAVPMYLLYELGLVLTRFVPKKREEPAA